MLCSVKSRLQQKAASLCQKREQPKCTDQLAWLVYGLCRKTRHFPQSHLPSHNRACTRPNRWLKSVASCWNCKKQHGKGCWVLCAEQSSYVVSRAPLPESRSSSPFRAERSTINPLPTTRCIAIEWHRPFEAGKSSQPFRILPLIRCKRYCLSLKRGSLVRNRRRCFPDKVID